MQAKKQTSKTREEPPDVLGGGKPSPIKQKAGTIPEGKRGVRECENKKNTRSWRSLLQPQQKNLLRREGATTTPPGKTGETKQRLARGKKRGKRRDGLENGAREKPRKAT